MIEKETSFDRYKPTHQRGSALLVSLVMLLLISIIAVGAMQSSILQERMSSSMHDRELAFQAAEEALRNAENQIRVNDQDWLDAQLFVYQVSGVNSNNDSPPDWLASPQEADSVGQSRAQEVDVDGVAANPTFYIEEINTPVGGGSTEVGVADPGTAVFRITARGFGGTGESVVLVRSVFRTR